MNTKNLSLAIVATITLSLTSCGNKSEKETSLEEATSEYETPISETDKITDEPTEDVSKETEEDVTTTKGSNDIDAYLKSYEEFLDQYIKLMKKAKNGDMSAMTEYPEYMEKLTDLSNKMENSKGEMSSDQMTKFLKLQTKLTQAAGHTH